MEPNAFVVRVFGPDGTIAGVGALVGERRIVTCAHVVNAALGLHPLAQERPDGVVSVDFPLAAPDGDPLTATVVAWVPPPRPGAAGDDVAGLLLADDPPAGTEPAKLGVEAARAGQALRVFGYPGRPPRPDGVFVPATVRGRVGRGRLQLDSGPEAAHRIQPGFSGSPVFDDAVGRVVGMLSESAPTDAPERDSYAISADQLRQAWPEALSGRWQRASTLVRGTVDDGAGGRTRTELTILHVSDLQLGKNSLFGGNGSGLDGPGGNGLTATVDEEALFGRLHDDLAGLARDSGLRPDLIVVTGDLAARGLRSEFGQVTRFLAALSEAAEIPRRHVAIVPGNHDVNRRACAAYFAEQDSEEEAPVLPYFPKWRGYVAAFNEFYADVPGVTFTPDEPWSLFAMPELKVVVAGLNSTMAESHLDADHYGWVGEEQLRSFARQLEKYRAAGWLRLAAVHHNAVRAAALDEENLRDAADLDQILGGAQLVNLLLHGHPHDARLHYLPSGLRVLATGSAAISADARATEVSNQYQLITVRQDGFTRHARQYAPGQRRWIGDTRISANGSNWRERHVHTLTDVDAFSWPGDAHEGDEPLETEAAATATTDGQREAREAAGLDVYHAGRNVPVTASARVVVDSATVDSDTANSASTRSAGRRPGARLSGVQVGEHNVQINKYDRSPAGAEESFLGRVAEASRVRYPSATITELPRTDCDYLRISLSPDGGQAEQWPVGVIDGPATREALDAFVTGVHAQFAAADPGVRSELVYGGPAASANLVAEAVGRGVRLRSFVEYQGLIDLGPLVEGQRARLAADRVYPEELYVEQRFRLPDSPGSRVTDAVGDGLIRQAISWLSADVARLIVVLGDFGRGKTSFLRQLTRRLPDELPGVLPVLVELRTLEKAPTLDELLAQHLVRQGVEDVSPAKLRYMIRSGRIALLFDGFDELELRVGYDNAAEYLQTLLDSVTDRAKVILTSRTQHFRSTSQVRTALGARVETRTGSRVVVLEDFTEDQIRQFLANLYQGDTARAEARFALLSEIENLLDLARNPRLLSFVAAMEDEQLHEVRQREGRITPAGLYREIIDFWLTKETERQEHQRGLKSFSKEERLRACTALALKLWSSTSPTIGLSELTDEVSATLTDLAERGYTEAQASHSIASGSLLVRTEDGAFAFIHQSVMEWLVAAAAAAREEEEEGLLSTRQLSRLMADFYLDLTSRSFAVWWVGTRLSSSEASPIAKQNALILANRLRSAGLLAEQNLAGADLRSLDLSGADLHGANLEKAILDGMRLVGTDLSGTRLVDAGLRGVQLTGGSLRGANLGGSYWTRAAILGTAGLDELTGAEYLDVAAVAGRDPADFMIRPPFSPRCLAFSPDGTLLAIGSSNIAEIIDAHDGRVLRILRGHTATVTGIAFSPDGALIATASADNTARTWDTTTGTPRTTFTGHDDEVRAVAFSPDGTLIATASSDRTARTWETTTGTPRTTLTGHRGTVYAVAFSPDGTLLATASSDRKARTWDTATGTPCTTLTGHDSSVTAVAFSPDGTLLATASEDYTARTWETTTGTPRTTLTGHDSYVNAVAFSPDGTLLATTSSDRTARTWETTTGIPRTTLTGHDSSVTAVAFSPDGTLLATTADDGTAQTWETTTGTPRTTLTGHDSYVNAVAFSPDGTLLATASNDNTARTWETTTGTPRTTLTEHRGTVWAVAFSPDGTLLATASSDRTARTWETTTGTPRTTLTGHDSYVNAVAFSPDGTLLATASSDRTARTWETTTGTPRTTLTGHDSSVTAVAFSPDGTLIATGADDGTARTWETTTGIPRTTLTGHDSSVTAVAFSPDGTLIATGADDGTARTWETTTGIPRTTLTGHDSYVNAVAFSPDGTLIATASNDGTAHIWDATTGIPRTTLTGHDSYVNAVAFSPDGTLIATASNDNTTRIWDAASGTTLATLVPLPDGGYATLLPDGSYKLDGNPGDTLWWAIKLCRFSPGELDPYVPGIKRLRPEDPVLPRRHPGRRISGAE